eukprot:8633964-Pyramimonas_sp.AAC.1
MKGGGRGRGSSPPVAPPSGGVKPDLSATPMAHTLIDYETHMELIGTIGVGANRSDMQEPATALQEPTDTKIAYGEWWGH